MNARPAATLLIVPAVFFVLLSAAALAQTHSADQIQAGTIGGVLTVDGANKRVGIGSASPSYKLEVNAAAKALNVSNVFFVDSTSVCIGTSCRTSWPVSDTNRGNTTAEISAAVNKTGANYWDGLDAPPASWTAQRGNTSAEMILATNGTTQWNAARVVGSTAVCIGTDCRTAWPAAGGSGDVTGISESGTTPLTFSGCDSGACSIGMDTDGSGPCSSGYACTGGHTHYQLDASDGSPAGALAVDADGNVGIGTGSPQRQLVVSAGSPIIGFKDTTDNEGWAIWDGGDYLQIYEYTNSGWTSGAGRLTVWEGGRVGAAQYCDENGANCKAITAMGGGGSLWSEETNIYGATGNIYYSGGSVGIGTASPKAALHVTRASIDTTPNEQGVQIGTQSTGYAVIEMTGISGAYIDFHNDVAGTDYDMRLLLAGNDRLGVYGGSLSVENNVWAQEYCDASGGNCKSVTEMGSAPSAVKYTEIGGVDQRHTGKFKPGSSAKSAYYLMNEWIQTHGCAGYHVCDASELIRYYQTYSADYSVGKIGWINSGTAAYGSASPLGYKYGNCHDWFFETQYYEGTVWSLGVASATCDNSYVVYCCK